MKNVTHIEHKNSIDTVYLYTLCGLKENPYRHVLEFTTVEDGKFSQYNPPTCEACILLYVVDPLEAEEEIPFNESYENENYIILKS